MTPLCCVSDHTEYLNMARNFDSPQPNHLTLNNNKIESMLNSDYFKQTRLQMLNDEIPSACKRCFVEEANGKVSKRLEEMNRFNFDQEKAKKITESDGSIPIDLQFVELRLGNLCNVKCRTCNPGSSSKWSSEYQILQTNLNFITPYPKSINCSWTESDSFWEDLLENSEQIELIYINGGEPTLVEKHWYCLERLIENGRNEHITLWYNINMTNLPDKLIQLWSKFKKVIVFASIDDLDERNSYIRTGSKWDEIVSNLDKLQSYSWIETSICQTVSWMNVYYLDEFYSYMRARNLQVHLNLVYDPIFLNPTILPKELKNIILDKIHSIDSWKLDFLKNHFKSNGSQSLFSQGITYNNYVDKSRKQDFKAFCPEGNSLIEKYLSLES